MFNYISTLFYKIYNFFNNKQLIITNINGNTNTNNIELLLNNVFTTSIDFNKKIKINFIFNNNTYYIILFNIPIKNNNKINIPFIINISLDNIIIPSNIINEISGPELDFYLSFDNVSYNIKDILSHYYDIHLYTNITFNTILSSHTFILSDDLTFTDVFKQI